MVWFSLLAFATLSLFYCIAIGEALNINLHSFYDQSAPLSKQEVSARLGSFCPFGKFLPVWEVSALWEVPHLGNCETSWNKNNVDKVIMNFSFGFNFHRQESACF